MGKKLFVGGLSWDTTDVSLQAAFEQYGEVVESRVILDRETGRSRGFGFVTFSKDEEAVAGEQGMNGAMLDGRTVRVNIAEDRRGGGGPGGPPRGRPSGPRGSPEVHTRGRPGGGRPFTRGPPNNRSGPSGPPRGGPGGRPGGPGGRPGGPGGGWNSRGSSGGFGGASNDPGDSQWSEDRRKVDHSRKKKKKKDGQREQEGYEARGAERRPKRESGRTWRDYAGEGDEDWDF